MVVADDCAVNVDVPGEGGPWYAGGCGVEPTGAAIDTEIYARMNSDATI